MFNAHYLVWADEAVNTWWAARGVDWVAFNARGVDWAAVNAQGIDYVVVASALEWRSSARYGDTVEVDADLEKLGRTSLTLRFVIRVGERECCVVRTTYVRTTGGTSSPWPEEIRALVSGS